jgi:cysteinyl-tRNA synthetase
MIPLSEATALYSAPVLRLFYLRSHYRSDAEYSEGLLDDAVAAWSRLTAFRRRVDVGDAVPDSDSVEAFRAAMDEDFNTPDAISVLFEIARSGNKRLDDGEGAGELGAAFDLITGVLGMVVADTSLDDVAGGITNLADELGITGSIPGELIEAIIALRTEARAEKNWAVADQIRDGFGALGIVVEDTSNGVRWHRE